MTHPAIQERWDRLASGAEEKLDLAERLTIENAKPGRSVIRRASTEDLAEVVALAAKFHAYGVWKDVPIDQPAFAAFTSALIENGAVFMSESGLIGGCLSPLYFAPSFTLAVEFFWWAPAGDGGELREAFEGWAREQDASAVQFSAMGDDHLPAVARLYRRAGYAPAETAFIKRF